MAQRPRGTRDFGPDEMRVRHHVSERVRGAFARYGYQEVQTPTFEELELFTAKSGEGIIDELYAFEDKGGRKMTLRPELTAPVMRFYFAEHAFDPKPLKWFYFSNCFRYDRPQAGRYREFWQFGCEQVGAGSSMAYAELIALANACLQAAGLKEYKIGVGHVGILKGAVDALGLADEQRGPVMRLIDKKDPGLQDHLLGLGVAADAAEGFVEILGASDMPEILELTGEGQELGDCLDDLDALGVNVHLDLGIARGLDYYNGIVFEVHVDSLGSQSQVLGGGGYDLAAVFGGQSTPTMGFGMGFDRVIEAAQSQGATLPESSHLDVAVGYLGDVARQVALQIVDRARDAGKLAEIDLMGRKPKKFFDWAQTRGTRYVVLIGDRDLEAGTAEVKNVETGHVERVAFDDITGALA